MKRLHSTETIRALDAWCEQQRAMPSLLLMEHAAMSCRKVLNEHLAGSRSRVLVFCGGGNNGGDGMALARLLAIDGHDVHVVAPSDSTKRSAAATLNGAMVRAFLDVMDASQGERVAGQQWDCVIDALVGVGGSASLRPDVAAACRLMNALSGTKVAIDVPTGLDVLTGDADEDAFQAHITITLAAPKPGLYRRRGPELSGIVHVGSIGIAQADVDAFALPMTILERDDISTLLPRRMERSTKHNHGRVLVIGGGRSMPGAPSLAAHAALASGAGLVELASPIIHPGTPREVMPTVVPATTHGTIGMHALDLLLSRAEKADVVVIGPGMGRDEETKHLLYRFIHETTVQRIVIDADALSIANDIPMGKSIVMTPHLREFASMVGTSAEHLDDDAIDDVTAFAARSSCIVHLKHFPSYTTDGGRGYILPERNVGLAKAGTGDVLAGIMGAIIATSEKTEQVLELTALSALIHATAGGVARQRYGSRAMMAHHVIDALAEVLP
jgi:ADP-dependent NAD(P)H-hydrate dehydratase / NAD(P)H-hydrate epimerase